MLNKKVAEKQPKNHLHPRYIEAIKLLKQEGYLDENNKIIQIDNALGQKAKNIDLRKQNLLIYQQVSNDLDNFKSNVRKKEQEGWLVISDIRHFLKMYAFNDLDSGKNIGLKDSNESYNKEEEGVRSSVYYEVSLVHLKFISSRLHQELLSKLGDGIDNIKILSFSEV